MARKKPRRESLALPTRELRHEGPPAPRHAVLLPLVDGLAALAGLAVLAPNQNSHSRAAAELVYEFRVVMHARIIGKSFRQVKGDLSEDASRDFRNELPQSIEMPSNPPKPEAIAAGQRLRATREALGIKTIRRFAQLMDEDESKLRKYEFGIAMVTSRFISKLRQHYGVDHNWIYAGDMRGLPHELALKLTDKPGA